MILAIKKREIPLVWLNATKHGDRWIPYKVRRRRQTVSRSAAAI